MSKAVVGIRLYSWGRIQARAENLEQYDISFFLLDVTAQEEALIAISGDDGLTLRRCCTPLCVLAGFCECCRDVAA
jgi:hypothetical protein